MAWHDDDDDRGSTRTTSGHTHPPLLPFVLIAIGAAALLDDVVGNGIGVWTAIWMAIGFWCLARAREGGPYPLLVIGAFIVSGAFGEILGAFFSRGISDAMETIGHAGGFIWIYNHDRGASRWALIAAAIFGVIGLGQLGLHLTDVVGEGGGWLLPAGVVVAGLLLIGAHRLPGPIRLAGLVFVGAAALSLLTNDDPERPGRRTIPTTFSDQAPLPEIGERTVWLDASRGDITVVGGDQAGVTANNMTVDTSEGRITIKSIRGNSKLTVPEGTKLHLNTGQGDIDVNVASADLDINSGSGDLTVLRPAGALKAVTGNGDIEAVLALLGGDDTANVSTGNGDIDLTVAGEPVISATTGSGDIEADGFDDNAPPDNVLVATGDDGVVTINTGNGDIVLTRATETAGLR